MDPDDGFFSLMWAALGDEPPRSASEGSPTRQDGGVRSSAGVDAAPFVDLHEEVSAVYLRDGAEAGRIPRSPEWREADARAGRVAARPRVIDRAYGEWSPDAPSSRSERDGEASESSSAPSPSGARASDEGLRPGPAPVAGRGAEPAASPAGSDERRSALGDLLVNSRVLGFLQAVPDDVLCDLAGRSLRQGRPQAAISRASDGRVSLGFGSGGAAKTFVVDVSSRVPRLAALDPHDSRPSIDDANLAMAEVAMANRRVPAVLDHGPSSTRGALAGAQAVLASLDARKLSEFADACGVSAAGGSLSLANLRVLHQAAASGVRGRTVVCVDVTVGAGANATAFPATLAFDRDLLGTTISVVPASGRSARMHAALVNEALPQPWTGLPDAGRTTVARLAGDKGVVVHVSRAELAAVLNRAGGEGAPRPRIADLAAVLFAVRQPRYEGSKVVGSRTGVEGASLLHDGFGPGEGRRRLHLDGSKLAALVCVGGPSAAALVLRLAAAERAVELEPVGRVVEQSAARSRPRAAALER